MSLVDAHINTGLKQLTYNIESYVEQVSDTRLQDILKKYALDQRFLESIGSRHHHKYTSGLAEHSLQVVRTALMLTNLYDAEGAYINRDYIIFGSLMHDVGKVFISESGKHTQAGYWIIYKELIDAGFSQFKADIIANMILVHQNNFNDNAEYKSIEAFIVHLSDSASSIITLGIEGMNYMSPFSVYSQSKLYRCT